MQKASSKINIQLTIYPSMHIQKAQKSPCHLSTQFFREKVYHKSEKQKQEQVYMLKETSSWEIIWQMETNADFSVICYKDQVSHKNNLLAFYSCFVLIWPIWKIFEISNIGTQTKPYIFPGGQTSGAEKCLLFCQVRAGASHGVKAHTQLYFQHL